MLPGAHLGKGDSCGLAHPGGRQLLQRLEESHAPLAIREG